MKRLYTFEVHTWNPQTKSAKSILWTGIGRTEQEVMGRFIEHFEDSPDKVMSHIYIGSKPYDGK